MKTAKLIRYAVVALVLSLVACKTGPKPGRVEVDLDPVQVKSGEAVFNQMCMACHQKNGVGQAGLGPRLNSPDFLGIASDEFLKKTILEGRSGTAMTAYKNVPPVRDKIDDVVAYIRSWQNDYDAFVEHKVDWEGKISGNVAKGEAHFARYCASCHGPEGGGYTAGGSAPGIGLSGFLQTASDDYIKTTMEVGRSGTAMRSFKEGYGLANLNDGDLNDIVAYLRSLEQ